jgi:hypothetical protein
MVFFLEITNNWQKTRDFWFKDFFLEIFRIQRLLFFLLYLGGKCLFVLLYVWRNVCSLISWGEMFVLSYLGGKCLFSHILEGNVCSLISWREMFVLSYLGGKILFSHIWAGCWFFFL